MPPLSFSNLPGVLGGVQSNVLTKPTALGQLRDHIAKTIGSTVSTNSWGFKRDAFIKLAQLWVVQSEAKELLSKIEFENLVQETAETARYKNKLRIILKNKTGKSLVIPRAEWDSGYEGVRLQAEISPLRIATEADGKRLGRRGAGCHRSERQTRPNMDTPWSEWHLRRGTEAVCDKASRNVDNYSCR